MNSKLKVALILLSVTGITACAPKATKLSDKSQLIECNGITHSLKDCASKAREVCPNGYEVQSVNNINDIGTLINPGGKTSTYIGNQDRSMLIKCN